MKNKHTAGDTVFVIRYAGKVYTVSPGIILDLKPFNAEFQGITIADRITTIRLDRTGEVVSYCDSKVYDSDDAAAQAISDFF